MDQAAHPARAVRFGAFEVDLRSGELRKQGVKIKLQEQPFQVLAMLLAHPGEVVTREELRKHLWPEDTFVDFDHSVSTAINKIRDALGDSAEGPRYVETLPRRGYRFIAPVETHHPLTASSERRGVEASPPPAERGELGSGLQPSPVGRGWPAEGGTGEGTVPRQVVGARHGVPLRRRWMGLAATLVLLICGGIGYRFFRPRSKAPAPPMRVVPFTSFPGHEIQPAFSPDGNQIAFSWDGEKEDNWDIYVKLIGGEKPLRLTTDPGEDRAPAWSPDGRYIAFYRLGQREDAVYIVPALGGRERKLNSLGKGIAWGGESLAWSPDGKYLAYVDGRPGEQGLSIFLLAVENPNDSVALTSLPGRFARDTHLRFSPNGQTLAFTRRLAAEAGVDVYTISRAGGEPKRLTFDNAPIRGLDWTQDGTYIVFASGRPGASSLWKVAASGGEPEPLTVGEGGAVWPALSRNGRRLVYTQRSFDSNIWRFEVSSATGRSTPPTKLIGSTKVDSCPQFSPDGKRIAFHSSRSGSGEIWICDSDGTAPLQLTFFGGPLAGTPRWSADGRQIAFDASLEGHSDIYLVNAEGGRPRRLTTGSSSSCAASWSRDGRWVYFASDRTGNWQTWKIPAGGGRAVQVTKQGGFAAFESPDGKTLYYAKGLEVPGLWRVPVEGGEETPVIEQLGAGYWGYWAVVEDGIFFYNLSTNAFEFLRFATHKVAQIAKPEKKPLQFTPGFAVSPDGRWILYSQADQQVADIMLVENFRW